MPKFPVIIHTLRAYEIMIESTSQEGAKKRAENIKIDKLKQKDVVSEEVDYVEV